MIYKNNVEYLTTFLNATLNLNDSDIYTYFCTIFQYIILPILEIILYIYIFNYVVFKLQDQIL